MDSTITSEEYIAKKQKLLNQKIDFSEKLKDFERKGNRWLELSKQFILDSNQALIIASEENLEAKRDFLKKIGSNPTLHHRRIQETPLFPYSALRAARQNFPENETSFIRAAGVGVGPTLEASKAPVLPLDDPAIILTLPYRISQSKL